MRLRNQQPPDRKLEATRFDWSFLDELVRDVQPGGNVSAKFQIFTLRLLFHLSDDEAREAITDAGGDRGIDAVLIDVESHEVHLFQFKYHEREDHVAKQFPARSVDLVVSFLTDLLERRSCLVETTNEALQSKIFQIWDVIEKAPARIHVHFVTNGRNLERVQRQRLVESLRKFGVLFHEHSSADLLRRVHSRAREKTRRKLNFLGGRTEFSVNGKRMIVGIVTLKDIAAFVAKPDNPSEIDNELFADNVRGMLGTQNDVNRAMSRMMMKPVGAEFVFRNNGITIVSDQVLYQAGGNFPIELVAPQIVNGCQTASTAFLRNKGTRPRWTEVRVNR